MLGSGNGRTTYVHPDDPTLILKVDTTPVKGRLRWYERPPKIRPSNHREIEGYGAMILALGQSHDFVTRIHGWEDTSAGPALLAEHATHDLQDVMALNAVFKRAETAPFSTEDLEWARRRYGQIADLFCEKGIYNHGLKPESVILGRRGGVLVMRLFDYKSIVYRQLISPRYLPRGEHNVQMLTIRAVLRKFDKVLMAK